jgi:hypothetical protein
VAGHLENLYKDTELDSITTSCCYLDEMLSAKKKLNRMLKKGKVVPLLN